MHEQQENRRYAAHGAGDSAYRHDGQVVRKSVLGLAVVLTLGFSAIEFIGGIWGNSLALIGDAGHMATDSASLLFALVANYLARKGADSDHSFGHGRIEVLAAFLNGLAMLGVVIWIFHEAIGRLIEPPPVAGAAVMAVATAGLLINLGVAWSLSRDQKNLNTRAALVHVAGDLLGSVAAILSGALIWIDSERFALADPILSMLVGVLVLHATYGILRDSVRVLLDGIPENVSFDEVGQVLESIEGVSHVHDLHVWTMAPGHGAICAHLQLREGSDWESVLRQAREVLDERFGIDHITLQPEFVRDIERGN